MADMIFNRWKGIKEIKIKHVNAKTVSIVTTSTAYYAEISSQPLYC